MSENVDFQSAVESPTESLPLEPNFINEPTVGANGSLRDFYKEYGYLVIPEALKVMELQELKMEALNAASIKIVMMMSWLGSCVYISHTKYLV